MSNKVAFIGLGRMGVKMAQQLLPKYEVVGFDVSEAGRQAASSFFEVGGTWSFVPTFNSASVTRTFVVLGFPDARQGHEGRQLYRLFAPVLIHCGGHC